LFGTVRSTYTLARDNPVLLVRVLRIIENDEQTNKVLKQNY